MIDLDAQFFMISLSPATMKSRQCREKGHKLFLVFMSTAFLFMLLGANLSAEKKKSKAFSFEQRGNQVAFANLNTAVATQSVRCAGESTYVGAGVGHSAYFESVDCYI